MAILAVLDETGFNGLDEFLKTIYVQNAENKQYFLDISPDEAGKVAFNLQSDLKKKEDLLKRAHTEKKEIGDKYEAFSKLGKTAEEIETELKTRNPEEINTLIENHKNELKRIEDSYKESVTAATAKAEKYQQQVIQSLVDNEIARLANPTVGDLNDTAPFVLQSFLKAVPVAEGSDEYTVRVFENGQPALAPGNVPKTPEMLLSEFREQKKFLSIFNAQNGGGTGGTNNQKTTPAGTKTLKRVDFEAGTEKGQDFSSFFAEGGQIVE
jgi:hypothetical protein